MAHSLPLSYTTKSIIFGLLQQMQIQGQQCVEIELQFEEKQPPSPSLVRNRRYRKLKELRDNGFFSQDAIKLRHPMLYHTYLGQHSQRSTPQNTVDCTLSQFLQKNLINLEYKQKLALQMDTHIKNQKENTENSQQNWQILEQNSGEIHIDNEHTSPKAIVKSWQIVEEEQIQLQQQNLIDHAQQLFLSGKVDQAYINYPQIDNNSHYDPQQQDHQDLDQKYLIQPHQEEDQRINQQYYTGIQDY